MTLRQSMSIDSFMQQLRQSLCRPGIGMHQRQQPQMLHQITQRHISLEVANGALQHLALLWCVTSHCCSVVFSIQLVGSGSNRRARPHRRLSGYQQTAGELLSAICQYLRQPTEPTWAISEPQLPCLRPLTGNAVACGIWQP